MVEIRGPFWRESVPTAIYGPSRTKQSHQKECDVNEILKKFRATGVITHRNKYEGEYGDFTDAPASYHEAMNIMREADEMFMSIPAHVRSEFDNDPGKFLEFVGNPDNAERMYDLGLARRPPAKQEEPKALETEPQAQSPASPESPGEE